MVTWFAPYINVSIYVIAKKKMPVVLSMGSDLNMERVLV